MHESLTLDIQTFVGIVLYLKHDKIGKTKL